MAGRPNPIRRVVSATDNPASGSVDLIWNFGGPTPFPYVWLRDSCLCPECFHPSTRSRSLRIDQLQLDLRPENVQVRSGQGQGHSSPLDQRSNRYFHGTGASMYVCKHIFGEKNDISKLVNLLISTYHL